MRRCNAVENIHIFHFSQFGGFYTEGINPYTIINNLTVFGIVIE